MAPVCRGISIASFRTIAASSAVTGAAMLPAVSTLTSPPFETIVFAARRRALRVRLRGGVGGSGAAAQQDALAAFVVIDPHMVLVADDQRVADAPADHHVEEFLDHAVRRRRRLLDPHVAI